MTSMTSPFDSLEFLAHLTPDQRKLWEAPPMVVARKQVVVSPDLPNNDVFFVLKGTFEAKTEPESGKIVFYRAIGPGDLFGELAAIDGGPRSATVTAQTDGQLVRIAGADFKALAEKSGPVAMWLIKRQIKMIRALTDRLFEQVAYDVSTRVRAEIVRLAEAAGIENNQADIKNMPTHEVLAVRLGTTREAVTREFSHLGPPKAGQPHALHLIEKRGRDLRVLNVEGLRRLVRDRTTVP